MPQVQSTFTQTDDPIVSNLLDDLLNVINGKIEFGPNIQCNLIDVSMPLANVSYGFQHTLQRPVQGYMIVRADIPTILYDGVQENNKTTFFIRSSVAGVKLTVLVF